MSCGSVLISYLSHPFFVVIWILTLPLFVDPIHINSRDSSSTGSNLCSSSSANVKICLFATIYSRNGDIITFDFLYLKTHIFLIFSCSFFLCLRTIIMIIIPIIINTNNATEATGIPTTIP